MDKNNISSCKQYVLPVAYHTLEEAKFFCKFAEMVGDTVNFDFKNVCISIICCEDDQQVSEIFDNGSDKLVKAENEKKESLKN
jgi:hypothetical protein